MQDRILWLINHTTLRDFEVPLLMELGFEVFVPKYFPNDETNGSASITYQYDKTLTIPSNQLSILNETDFYTGSYSAEVIDIMNKYFSISFSGFFLDCLERLLDDFNGNIFLRVFGAQGDFGYYEYIQHYFGRYYIEKIKKVSYRFWFSAAYEEVIKNEVQLFKNNSVFLPLGIKNGFYADENTWKGNDLSILFVCPRIGTSQYYHEVYTQFKENFSSFPHVIAGKQFTFLKDQHISGYLSPEQYKECYINKRVMFYHSQEPRHLHYHPIEAMIIGMPVVFMANGMLMSLGGDDQPGMCRTFEEAKEKVSRILNNDTQLISDIVKKQKIISNKFTIEYCKEKWIKNFIPLIEKNNLTNIQCLDKSKRIAIILPIPYKGGTLNGLKNIVRMIDHAASANNEKIEIILYCVRDVYDMENDFHGIEKHNIKIREFFFEECNAIDAERMLRFSQSTVKPSSLKSFYIINDNYKGGTDCDFWILISDRFEKPLLPLRPYAMVIYDYIQRYFPSMFEPEFENAFSNGFIETTRMAKLILTTTPQTACDVKNYLGIPKNKIFSIGVHFDPLVASASPSTEIIDLVNSQKNYIIWTTNPSRHKNINLALTAIKRYFEEGGNFNIIITGPNTDMLDPKTKTTSKKSLYDDIHQKINSFPLFSEKLYFKGNLNTSDYLHVLKSAKFLFHAAIIDNGTFSVLEAAARNVPSLSSNYPQMRHIANEFNLKMHFFDPHDSDDIANSLMYMQEHYNDYKNHLPCKEMLLSQSYLSYSQELWNIIRRAIR